MPVIVPPNLANLPDRMSRVNGKPISEYDHLIQSIGDILSTPLGSRVARRDYGSDLFNLLDHPINRLLILKIHQAILVPLAKWEPRIKLTQSKVDVTDWQNGGLSYDLYGTYRITNAPLTIEKLQLNFYGQAR